MEIAGNIRNFLAKLQNLSEQKKKIVLWTIVVVLACIMGYFWISGAISNLQKAGQIKLPKMPDINIPSMGAPLDQTTDWKIFNFSNYGGFEIKYPTDWTFRQYDSGVAFFPQNKASENTTGNGMISVGFYSRGANYCQIPFADYVKIAGPSEIQNYESLNTMDEQTNGNGLKMYKTAWNYTDFSGDKKVSLPITYFGSGAGKLCGSFDASLNDANYSDIYDEMLSTFNFVK